MAEEYINPYNFVPLGSGARRSEVSEIIDGKTGVIDCTLQIKTPLFIPDTKPYKVGKDDKDNKVDKGHKYYDFFKVDDSPVIPGSELRGVVRNIYEIITDSCFSVLTSNIITKRCNTVNNPGLLKWDNATEEWQLFRAEKAKTGIVGNNTVKRVWKTLRGSISTTYFTKQGKINIGGDKLQNAVKKLNLVIDSYAENQKDNTSAIKIINDSRPKTDGELHPVFYNLENDTIILSPAQISRKVFDNTVTNLLGSYKSCDGKNNELCSACKLFGTVNGENAVNSRLRFTDSYCEGNADFSDETTLKELASPKITSVEFYSVPNNAQEFSDISMWDYDSTNIALRGRKFYFHIPEAANNNRSYKADEKNERNISAKLLTNGTFKFSVYFDNITETELSGLVWALTLGENKKNSLLMQKIGHGKPLGLGSVKITVDRITERAFNVTGDCSELSYSIKEITEITTDETAVTADEYVIKALKNMCDFNLVKGKNVAYPIGVYVNNEDNTTSRNTMQWFTLNHGKISKSGQDRYKYALYPVTDSKSVENMLLPLLEKEKTNGNKPACKISAYNSHPNNRSNVNSNSRFCASCGKPFVPQKPQYNHCPECNKKWRGQNH